MTFVWLISVFVGLVAFVALAMFRWPDTQRSFWWRLLFCFIAAAALTPGSMNNGHSQSWSFPVILIFPVGLIPVAVVSIVLAGIWSVILRVRR
jgi:uncharacterized membrane protein YhaH (DUF805 family)